MGFAIKFYTEDGNWDLVGINSPTFFIRDPILFPNMVHSIRRNPVTHLKDSDMLWDFHSLLTQTSYELTKIFSDSGIPDGYRHMDGYGSHTFKLVNAINEAVYCKFHYKTNQGLKYLSGDVAQKLTGSDPDYSIRDLYNAIANGNFPSWTFYIQVMTFEQARTWKENPFDITKGRLFAYADTQRYRLGTNYLQIPVNCPLGATPKNYERSGQQIVTDNQGGAPNYFPNSFNGPKVDPSIRLPAMQLSGDVDRYNSEDEDNFCHAGTFYREELNEDEKFRLARNIAADLSKAKEFIQDRQVYNFWQADQDFGRRLKAELENIKKSRSTL